MKVWVATRGEYSDYQVVGAFSTKELAERMNSLLSDMNPPLEVEVDEPLTKLDAGYRKYHVLMEKAGNVLSQHVESDLNADWEWVRNADETFHWQGWAKDEQHAIKIANERRTQAIVKGEL